MKIIWEEMVAMESKQRGKLSQRDITKLAIRSIFN